MTYVICNVIEGRGKTGKAKTGPIRMLFQDQCDHEIFHAFIMECRRIAVEKYGEDQVSDRREYFNTSYRNLLDRHFTDVFDVTALDGRRIIFVNRTSLDPRICIEREIPRMITDKGALATA